MGLKESDMENIKAKIVDKADPSVGAFGTEWIVECPFGEDADKEDREFFREGITQLYSEYSFGRIEVTFSDEAI